MLLRNNKDKGRAGLSLAITYFGCNGYTVCLPINDTQWYDLIVEKDGIIQTVQCKFTSSADGAVDLRSTGGTNGGVYDHSLNYPIDLLFCANEKGNLFLIPFEDLRQAGVCNSIRLRTQPNSNGQGFNTCSYIVRI